MTIKNITSPTLEQYTELKARHNAFELWRDGRSSVNRDEVPKEIQITNDERGMIEFYEWYHNPPTEGEYMVYVSERDGQVTNWTGISLGNYRVISHQHT